MARFPLALLFTALCAAQTFPLNSVEGLKPSKVKVEPATFKGRAAVRVTEAGDANEDRLAVLPVEFQDGVVEAELAGEPAAGSFQGARGFVGIAFRVAPDLSRFECFYLRPTNGRADDQVRRNHSIQYVSFPEFPWQRLRKESPEKYESYADLVPGEWTHVKIEVRGDKARLYVGGAEQPTLIVNDLKHGVSKGALALWIGPGTVAHFSSLKVTRE